MDTIAAISTAIGVGGIGVVRISGENAISLADKIFKSFDGKKLADMRGYSAKYGKIFDDIELIDEAIVLIFRAPHSYTGEDVAEISCHGGIYVVKKVLDAALKNGARLAEAGEFTKRAFINGKMSLEKAESVMNLISSHGEKSRKIAVGGMEGNLNNVINIVKNELIEILSKLDVWADYPDECDFEIDKNELKSQIKATILKLSDLKGRYSAARAVTEGLKIAVVGKPNVGKSSLMNLLLGYKRAIVTDIPGTTRDIISEHAMLGDIPIMIFDTAGIRDTGDMIEKIGIDKTKEHIKDADIVFVLFDGSGGITAEDKDIMGLLDFSKSIAVINKTDLNLKIDVKFIEEKFKNTVKISAHTGIGMDELQNAVYNFVGMYNLAGEAAVPASERQFEVISRALRTLKTAASELESGVTFDAVTVLIQEALLIVGEITGENVNEEVINNIFAKFCVGK